MSLPKFKAEPDNELVLETMRNIIQRCKGAHTVDVIVRKDGKEYRYEADWIKNMQEVEV